MSHNNLSSSSKISDSVCFQCLEMIKERYNENSLEVKKAIYCIETKDIEIQMGKLVVMLLVSLDSLEVMLRIQCAQSGCKNKILRIYI